MELCIIRFMDARLLAITIMLLLVISGCGQSYNPKLEKDCEGCDLSGANMRGADLWSANVSDANLSDAVLTGAGLSGTNLMGANLLGANLEGVIGADFTGALNVPPKRFR